MQLYAIVILHPRARAIVDAAMLILVSSLYEVSCKLYWLHMLSHSGILY